MYGEEWFGKLSFSPHYQCNVLIISQIVKLLDVRLVDKRPRFPQTDSITVTILQSHQSSH